MLRLIVGILAAVTVASLLGIGGVAGVAAGLAKVAFWSVVIVFLGSLLAGLLR